MYSILPRLYEVVTKCLRQLCEFTFHSPKCFLEAMTARTFIAEMLQNSKNQAEIEV